MTKKGFSAWTFSCSRKDVFRLPHCHLVLQFQDVLNDRLLVDESFQHPLLPLRQPISVLVQVRQRNDVVSSCSSSRAIMLAVVALLSIRSSICASVVPYCLASVFVASERKATDSVWRSSTDNVGRPCACARA